MLTLVKLKNISNNEEIINWLINLLKESKSGPLTKEINFPNKNFFILKKDDTIIPAYIFCKKDEAIVLWVHETCRRNGYAKFMINTLGINYAIAAPESFIFWSKMGFKKISTIGVLRMKREKDDKRDKNINKREIKND